MPDPQPPRADGAIPVVSVATGEYLYRAGEVGDAFFIVSTGQVELLKRNETFRRLALLGPGDVFGEDSAFDGQARACDARAAGAATVLKVRADVFLELVRVRPDVATAVIRATAGRLLQSRSAALALALPPVAHARTAAGAPAVARFIHVESGSHFMVPNQPETVIGRADPRTKFTPDVELSSVDSHRSLSRRHAVVTRVDAGFQLAESPKVANGTFHNGVRLTTGTAVPLHDGDEVSFGLIRTVFRIP
ncbi:MAG: cyclic nucleotide-binding domain-containing protein [Vicinamibacterales bacterium]